MFNTTLIMDQMESIWQKVMSIPYKLKPPTSCMICRTRSMHMVCEKCCAYFKTLGPACRTCATPLPDDSFLQCGLCIRFKPDIDLVITHYQFAEPLRSVLHEYKYREGFYLENFIVKLMLNALPIGYQTECIIPVPIHTKRLRERGFDHTRRLATPLAHYLNCPIDYHVCKKIIHTPAQAQLKAHRREGNVLHAYHITPTRYQQVTLVDDLMTTGHTANEIAKSLKQSGVQRVDLWCCAKTVPYRMF